MAHIATQHNPMPRRAESLPLAPASPIDYARHPDTLRTLLQRCADLDLSRRVTIDRQIANGGNSDVFVGRKDMTIKVAVKKMRIHAMRAAKFEKALARELYIWSKLQDNRILPLEGFYFDESSYLNLVSKWMDNGTALRYLEANPSKGVLHLAVGVAEGIEYLHKKKIVHSDIKPDNVLINDNGEPLLCDFGISRMLESPTFNINETTGVVNGTIRYMAKELLTEENPVHTEKSDIWSFGMTVYTLLTRRQPYNDMQTPVQALIAIVNGKLPLWPMDIQSWPAENQILSRMCERCWDEPAVRPNISTLITELQYLSSASEHRSLGMNSVLYPLLPQIPITMNTSPTNVILPQKKRNSPGTVRHMSSGRLSCIFLVDGYRLTFDASLSPGLPQFSCSGARIYYDESDELTGTQSYTGFVGSTSYTLNLENGTTIVGDINISHCNSMSQILGSGTWIST